MAKQTTKRCHWVSQAYLRAFAADADRQKIWRFSKNAGEPELKPIEKVAVKFHLYAPEGPDGRRDDALEKKLSDLEKFFGEPTWAAACNDFPDYGWEPLRKMMALIVATMYLRNPLQFERTKDLHRQMVALFSAGELPEVVEYKGTIKPFDTSGWPAYRDAGEEDLRRHWNEQVSEAGWLAELLLPMRWAVIFSEEPVFITSDNPVIFGDTISPFGGLKRDDAMVTFPLSPTRLLLMDNRHTEPDARYYPLKYDHASLNGLIWRNAIDHMFSPRHPDQVCAEMLADAERMGVA